MAYSTFNQIQYPSSISPFYPNNTTTPYSPSFQPPLNIYSSSSLSDPYYSSATTVPFPSPNLYHSYPTPSNPHIYGYTNSISSPLSPDPYPSYSTYDHHQQNQNPTPTKVPPSSPTHNYQQQPQYFYSQPYSQPVAILQNVEIVQRSLNEILEFIKEIQSDMKESHLAFKRSSQQLSYSVKTYRNNLKGNQEKTKIEGKTSPKMVQEELEDQRAKEGEPPKQSLQQLPQPPVSTPSSEFENGKYGYGKLSASPRPHPKTGEQLTEIQSAEITFNRKWKKSSNIQSENKSDENHITNSGLMPPENTTPASSPPPKPPHRVLTLFTQAAISPSSSVYTEPVFIFDPGENLPFVCCSVSPGENLFIAAKGVNEEDTKRVIWELQLPDTPIDPIQYQSLDPNLVKVATSHPLAKSTIHAKLISQIEKCHVSKFVLLPATNSNTWATNSTLVHIKQDLFESKAHEIDGQLIGHDVLRLSWGLESEYRTKFLSFKQWDPRKK
jgi:hypothetical protein